MYCNKKENLRVLIIPVKHSLKEDKFEVEIYQFVESCNNLMVFWESIHRSQNNSFLSGKRYDKNKIGLEDPKLLALFEIVLFIIVDRDESLHEKIYTGTGTLAHFSHADSNLESIYQKASNIAKGTQSIINLRDYFNGEYTKNDEKDLFEAVYNYDIEQLIEDREDLEKLDFYINKLYDIYNLLIKSLELQNYNYIDYDYIHESLINVNLKSSLILKEYLKYVRDISNSIYIVETMQRLNISNSICCVGDAHTEDISKELIKRNVEVNISNIFDRLSDNFTNEKISKIIKEELNKFLIY